MSKCVTCRNRNYCAGLVPLTDKCSYIYEPIKINYAFDLRRFSKAQKITKREMGSLRRERTRLMKKSYSHEERIKLIDKLMFRLILKD